MQPTDSSMSVDDVTPPTPPSSSSVRSRYGADFHPFRDRLSRLIRQVRTLLFGNYQYKVAQARAAANAQTTADPHIHIVVRDSAGRDLLYACKTTGRFEVISNVITDIPVVIVSLYEIDETAGTFEELDSFIVPLI